VKHKTAAKFNSAKMLILMMNSGLVSSKHHYELAAAWRTTITMFLYFLLFFQDSRLKWLSYEKIIV